MILIAHRGNLFGPNVQNENRPEYLENAVNAGFNIEFDIRLINDQFFLGHDEPEYQIFETWLLDYREVSWVHCKNHVALTYFASSQLQFNYFWHEKDKYTMVSNGKVWIYPGEENIYAVCSDFVGDLKAKAGIDVKGN